MNKKDKIIVLDSHSRASLSIVQSLGESNFSIVLAGEKIDPIASKSRYVSQYLRYPDPMMTKSGFVDWILSNVTSDIQAVFAVTDRTIYPLVELRKTGWNDPRFLLPDDKGFQAFFFKDQTISLARTFGFELPRTVIIDNTEDAENKCPFNPVFIKSPRSKYWKDDKGISLSPVLVRDPAEITNVVQKFLEYDKVILQEYVPGRGCGIEILSDHGKIVLTTGHKRLHEYPLTGGGSTYRMSWEPPQDLMDKVTKLIEHIAWHGVAMFEFKITADKIFLIEVNGRFWGSLPLSKAEGLNFPLALLKVQKGDDAGDIIVKKRKKVYARNLTSDALWFLANLKANKKDPYLMTAPVITSLKEYFRIFGGQEVWDHASWKDPAPISIEIFSLFFNGFKKVYRHFANKLFFISQKRRSIHFITHTKIKNILVVCYGNICRSPFVQKSMEKELGNKDILVKSTGFHQRSGRTCPEKILKIARQEGLDLDTHHSSLINKELVDEADCVIIMDEQNWRDMKQEFPRSIRKIVWLGAFLEKSSFQIPDPYELSYHDTEKILDSIIGACTRISQAINKSDHC